MKDFSRIATAKDALAACEAGIRANRFINTTVFKAIAEACIAGAAVTRVAMPGVAEPAAGKTLRLTNRELVEALQPTWEALAVNRLVELGYYVEGTVVRSASVNDPCVLYKMTIAYSAAKQVDEQFVPAEIVLPSALAASQAAGGSNREVTTVQRHIAMVARCGQRFTDYTLRHGAVLLRDSIADLLHKLGYEVSYMEKQPYGTMRIRWAPEELVV